MQVNSGLDWQHSLYIMNKMDITKGVNLTLYQPRGGKSYKVIDLARFLKKFELNSALRLMGELSFKILMNGNAESIKYIHGVPISDSVLAYLAMLAIENSNDHKSQLITIEDIAKASDMYFGLPDRFMQDNNLDAFLIRFGAAQFDYDREINNIVPRTFIIYCQLWQQVSEAKEVDIDSAIQKISKLSIEEILIIGFTYFSACKVGWFPIYEEVKFEPRDRQFFTKEKQLHFLKWLAISYWGFRNKSLPAQKQLPHPDYEKNRFNLLVKYPIVTPDVNPKPMSSGVNIVPVPRLLLERITRGIYFDLADHFKGKSKTNRFREAFGHVFQSYVGLLFEKSNKKLELLPEWKYDKPEKGTSDWIIIENDKATIIEVKQSGLFLPAKILGDIDSVKDSLVNTIGKAVKQLWSFENDIRSGVYEELNCLSKIDRFERIVVTYDRTYFANSVLREHALEIARKDIPEIQNDYYWHTISVEELEYVLGLDFPTFFEFLEGKRLDQEYREWDFRNFYARKYKQTRLINPYLEQVKHDFIEHVKMNIIKEFPNEKT